MTHHDPSIDSAFSQIRRLPTRPIEPLTQTTAPMLASFATLRRSPLDRLKLAKDVIFGPLLARHAAFIAIEDDMAVVAVPSDWRDAVFQSRITLSRRVRTYCPKLRGIRLVNAPLIAPKSPSLPDSPPPPSPRTASIADPQLRAAFDALLAARAQKASEG